MGFAKGIEGRKETAFIPAGRCIFGDLCGLVISLMAFFKKDTTQYAHGSAQVSKGVISVVKPY